ncbi:MAG: hypothetical protein WCI73_14970 [Phycisphaerae bacterium]
MGSGTTSISDETSTGSTSATAGRRRKLMGMPAMETVRKGSPEEIRGLMCGLLDVAGPATGSEVKV